MPDLKIDSLQLGFSNIAGHEHRVQPIALRAAALLAERFNKGQSGGAGGTNVNLEVSSDEEVASAIADAWLETLAMKLRR
jgi:hypothetical protein